MRFIIFLAFQLFVLSGWSQQRIRVACVGNSITFGAGVESRESNSYPAKLAAGLGHGYDVRNFGKNGATLLRKGNLPYTGTEEYKNALAFEPHLVFIKLGTNDTKPVNRVFLNDYVKDFKQLIADFQGLASKPRVVILLPVPVFSVDTIGITRETVEKIVIPAARQVAYETGVEIVNLYNLFIESPDLFPDKIHPNAEGAARIAARVEEFVKTSHDPGFDLRNNLPLEGGAFNFHGFQGYDFKFMSRNAKVVLPKRPAKGRPWVWRARFWGHEPQADIALLERGFHIAYCDVAELFGNEEALGIWDGFYKTLMKGGLAEKSSMEGMSRGGVYVYRWAARYPERVNAIYADAPVLDLKSWPGGEGKS